MMELFKKFFRQSLQRAREKIARLHESRPLPTAHPRSSSRPLRGQSLIELALVLPILLIMLLGIVEVALFIGRYLDILDLTREAARFASVRDPFTTANIADVDCSNAEPFNFYYHTACIFSPPGDSQVCQVSHPLYSYFQKFCNGLNSYVVLDSQRDDIVISVFTIGNKTPSGSPTIGVTNAWPSPNGYWALSDNDADTNYGSNWRTDCEGNVIIDHPYYTASRIEESLSQGATMNKGFITVEFYYCYEQALNLPFLNQFVPNPIRIHAYTLMPLPAAAPTATPEP
jgi:hypothetical protein